MVSARPTNKDIVAPEAAEDVVPGTPDDEVVALSREGLLRVDTLLPRFFLPEHAGIRYT